VTLEKERQILEVEHYDGDDEGFLMEMEDELEAMKAGEDMIIETLESLDTTLDYVNGRINKLYEGLKDVDIE
jgi:hypothetical protein